MKKLFLILFSVGMMLDGLAQTAFLSSPDKRIKISVDLQEGSPRFSVDCQGKRVVESAALGIRTSSTDFSSNLALKNSSSITSVTDDYAMISGKRSHCVNHGNECTYTFATPEGRNLLITFRAYNNGVTFRYTVPEINKDEQLVDELTAYPVKDGVKRWMQIYAPDSYENFFPTATNGDSKSHQWGYPALVEPVAGTFVLITEANIERGHCATLLNNSADAQTFKVQLPEAQVSLQAGRKDATEWTSPWRLLMIGSSADIVESTLVTDVSAPAKYEDVSWIHPAPASWVYWAYNHGSKDYAICKQFVDLAADMHWPYCLIDWEWDRMTNGGDIDDLVAYARQKNVKLFLWYNSSTNWVGEWGPNPMYRLNQPGNRNEEYRWLKAKGIDGIKIDFFKDDTRRSMDYYIDLLEDGYKHQMMITFHGTTVPRGWQRTYPNMMTYEGVRGAEWYNNTPEFTSRAASHNTILPFTRNVLGSMDYTPGTFSDSQHPHITTHGHELALYVLFESAIQHMPDRPDIYLSLPQEVQQVLSTLPTTWDDTRLLGGYPGDDVILARRKGDTWYIAGINGTDAPRTLAFSLKRLGVKGGMVRLFADGDDDHSFKISSTAYKANQKISTRARGGFLMVLK